ncbi:MAG: VOC family protein [Sedimentisphaerales bacterium]|nr:VOC family protein [Sedimentisphaerales bacterium]
MTHRHQAIRLLTIFLLLTTLITISSCCIHVEEKRTQTQEIKTFSSNKNRIRLEHVAINVEDPVAMVKWYCDNLEMKVVRKGPPPVNMRFISDAGGNMMLELYNNPPDQVPDYPSMNPLSLHIAFMVDDVKAITKKLMAAGATIAVDINTTPAGDEIVMLRDPWGVPIQFIKRARPMLHHN